MDYIVLILRLVFRGYEAILFLRAVITFMPDLEYGSFGHTAAFITRITEPAVLLSRWIMYSIFKLLRVDASRWQVDFSPVAAIIIVHIAGTLICGFLAHAI